MWFINKGGPVKIRVGKANDCYWSTIKTGESVELPKKIGLSLGLKIKTTKGKINDKVVETKQIVTKTDINVSKNVTVNKSLEKENGSKE